MTYYYTGRSGDPFVGATIHASDDCSTLSDDAPVRPIADSTIESVNPETVDWCPACHPLADDSASGGADSGVESDGDGAEIVTADDKSDRLLVESGVCPWCPPDDRYEGDHVGQHASSAHPEQWAEYRE